MKATIYTRFSPRRNADKSESCEVQEAICKDFCAAKDYEVQAVYHDKDVSGKDEFRPQLWAAIESLHRGDALVVYKRDRLARSVFLSEQIKRRVAEQGAKIEAFTGDVGGDSPEAEMVRQIMSATSEYERKAISLRTAHAMRRHMANGKRIGRYAPYGHRISAEDNTRTEPDPAEQSVLVDIQMLHDTGMNPNAIMEMLNEMCPDKARNGKKWNRKQVAKIIERFNLLP